MGVLDALQRFYALAAGISAIIALLIRMVYRIGRMTERIEALVKENHNDHARYDAHLTGKHVRHW
jgi:hypothetical protein